MAVVYRLKGGEKEFLLMKRKKNWVGYEFVKGGIEKSETPEKAVERELREETGISKSELISIKKTKLTVRVKYPSTFVSRNYSGAVFSIFIIEVKGRNEIKVDPVEHSGYAWVCEKDVLGMFWRGNLKRVFRDCVKILHSENK